MIRSVGKSMRMKRVIDATGVSVICALHHGMTSPQFLEPLADIETRTKEAVAGGANVIMMSKGMIRIAEPAFAPTTSLALLLSASANPERGEPEVVQIAEVEEASRLGADAVVLFTALAAASEVPARISGHKDLGTLEPDARADIVVLDDTLAIDRVLADGVDRL